VAIAPKACLSVRKVRTAQGTVLGNSKAARADGKCNRKIPPGEMQIDECRSQNEEIDTLFFILHSAFILLHFLR
jgi:hypothetical protein